MNRRNFLSIIPLIGLSPTLLKSSSVKKKVPELFDGPCVGMGFTIMQEGKEVDFVIDRMCRQLEPFESDDEGQPILNLRGNLWWAKRSDRDKQELCCFDQRGMFPLQGWRLA
jgi:hypothetical protein